MTLSCGELCVLLYSFCSRLFGSVLHESKHFLWEWGWRFGGGEGGGGLQKARGRRLVCFLMICFYFFSSFFFSSGVCSPVSAWETILGSPVSSLPRAINGRIDGVHVDRGIHIPIVCHTAKLPVFLFSLWGISLWSEWVSNDNTRVHLSDNAASSVCLHHESWRQDYHWVWRGMIKLCFHLSVIGMKRW